MGNQRLEQMLVRLVSTSAMLASTLARAACSQVKLASILVSSASRLVKLDRTSAKLTSMTVRPVNLAPS